MRTLRVAGQSELLPHHLTTLPDGVGRYKWTLTDRILRFVALNQDACTRGVAWLANRSYSRTDTA